MVIEYDSEVDNAKKLVDMIYQAFEDNDRRRFKSIAIVQDGPDQRDLWTWTTDCRLDVLNIESSLDGLQSITDAFGDVLKKSSAAHVNLVASNLSAVQTRSLSSGLKRMCGIDFFVLVEGNGLHEGKWVMSNRYRADVMGNYIKIQRFEKMQSQQPGATRGRPSWWRRGRGSSGQHMAKRMPEEVHTTPKHDVAVHKIAHKDTVPDEYTVPLESNPLINHIEWDLTNFASKLKAARMAKAWGCTRLLIVDHQVSQDGILAATALPDIMVVEFDSQKHSQSELVAKIREAHFENRTLFESIAIAQHGPNHKNIWKWTRDTIVDMDGDENDLIYTLAPVMEALIIALEKTNKGGEPHIDLLACGLAHICPEFVPALESKYCIDFRASVDDTGNPLNGGNWIMETDAHYNVSKDYLDQEKVQEYRHLMGARSSVDATFAKALSTWDKYKPKDKEFEIWAKACGLGQQSMYENVKDQIMYSAGSGAAKQFIINKAALGLPELGVIMKLGKIMYRLRKVQEMVQYEDAMADANYKPPGATQKLSKTQRKDHFKNIADTRQENEKKQEEFEKRERSKQMWALRNAYIKREKRKQGKGQGVLTDLEEKARGIYNGAVKNKKRNKIESQKKIVENLNNTKNRNWKLKDIGDKELGVDEFYDKLDEMEMQEYNRLRGQFGLKKFASWQWNDIKAQREWTDHDEEIFKGISENPPQNDDDAKEIQFLIDTWFVKVKFGDDEVKEKDKEIEKKFVMGQTQFKGEEKNFDFTLNVLDGLIQTVDDLTKKATMKLALSVSGKAGTSISRSNGASGPFTLVWLILSLAATQGYKHFAGLNEDRFDWTDVSPREGFGLDKKVVEDVRRQFDDHNEIDHSKIGDGKTEETRRGQKKYKHKLFGEKSMIEQRSRLEFAVEHVYVSYLLHYQQDQAIDKTTSLSLALLWALTEDDEYRVIKNTTKDLKKSADAKKEVHELSALSPLIIRSIMFRTEGKQQ